MRLQDAKHKILEKACKQMSQPSTKTENEDGFQDSEKLLLHKKLQAAKRKCDALEQSNKQLRVALAEAEEKIACLENDVQTLNNTPLPTSDSLRHLSAMDICATRFGGRSRAAEVIEMWPLL